ncbi:MAG: hypothetical protein WBQ57_12845 [Rhodanobacteraceae bacterium]
MPPTRTLLCCQLHGYPALEFALGRAQSWSLFALLAEPITMQVLFRAGLACDLNRAMGDEHCVPAPPKWRLVQAVIGLPDRDTEAIARSVRNGKRLHFPTIGADSGQSPAARFPLVMD